MWNQFKRTKGLAVGVCERCGRACGERCSRAMLQQLWLGIRV